MATKRARSSDSLASELEPAAKMQRVLSAGATAIENDKVELALLAYACALVGLSFDAESSRALTAMSEDRPATSLASHYLGSLAARLVLGWFHSLKGRLRADHSFDDVRSIVWERIPTESDANAALRTFLFRPRSVRFDIEKARKLFCAELCEYVPSAEVLQSLGGLAEYWTEAMFTDELLLTSEYQEATLTVALMQRVIRDTPCTNVWRLYGLVDAVEQDLAHPGEWVTFRAMHDSKRFGSADDNLYGDTAGYRRHDRNAKPTETTIEQLADIVRKRQWWRNERLYGRCVRLWMAGYHSGLVWDQLGVRAVGFLGTSISSYEPLPRNDQWLMHVTDGEQHTHELFFSINAGDVDANTGIFGRVESHDCLWAVFYGTQAGDCGTLTEATPGAMAQYAPRQLPDRKAWCVLPLNTIWGWENAFQNKAQVEAVCLAAAMMVLGESGGALCVPLPSSVAAGAMTALLRVIQQKALAQAESDPSCELQWPVYLPPEILAHIASFCVPTLPILQKALCEDEEHELSLEELTRCVYEEDERDSWPFDEYHDHQVCDIEAQSQLRAKALSVPLSESADKLKQGEYQLLGFDKFGE